MGVVGSRLFESWVDPAKFIYPLNDNNARIRISAILHRRVNWDVALRSYIFTNDDITRFGEVMDWKAVARFHPITKDFYTLHESRLAPFGHAISLNKRVSFKTKLTLGDALDWYFTVSFNEITANEAESILRSNDCRHVVVEALVSYKVIPETLLETILERWNTPLICERISLYQPLHSDFVVRHETKLIFGALSRNEKLCSCVAITFHSQLEQTTEVEKAFRRDCDHDPTHTPHLGYLESLVEHSDTMNLLQYAYMFER